MQAFYRVLVSLPLLAAACEMEESFDDSIACRPTGGVWLNTSSIGATMFSELDLTGKPLAGMTLTGVLLKRPNNAWILADKIELVNGQIRAKAGANTYTGADLIGSRWKLSPTGKDPIEMWISSYTVVSNLEARYVFQALDEHGAVVNVCSADAYGAYTAIPLKDLTIDPATGAVATRKETIYLACTSGAVGKVIVWGYSPSSLKASEFETAIRMVRADYCYDGTSWTMPGTSVQLRDKWAINAFLYPDAETEAVWTEAGVACLKAPRWSNYTASQVTCAGQHLPACPDGLEFTTYPQALFWTKRVP